MFHRPILAAVVLSTAALTASLLLAATSVTAVASSQQPQQPAHAAVCYLAGYTFYQGKSSSGSRDMDIPMEPGWSSTWPGDVAEECSKDDECVGFASKGGVRKRELLPQNRWRSTAIRVHGQLVNNAWDGLYTKNEGSSPDVSPACIIPGYTFYLDKTDNSTRGNIGGERWDTYVSPVLLASKCNNDTHCVAFSTRGHLKNDSMVPMSQWITEKADYSALIKKVHISSYSRSWDGMYVKHLDVPGYQFYPGKDSVSNNIKQLKGLHVQELADKCSADVTCKGFNSKGYLKRALNAPTQFKPMFVSGRPLKFSDGIYVKVNPPAIAGYKFFKGKDSSGHPDISGAPMAGLLPEQLAALCNEDANCTAFNSKGSLKSTLDTQDKWTDGNWTQPKFWEGLYVKEAAVPANSSALPGAAPGGNSTASNGTVTPPANPAGGNSTATNGTVTPPANPAGGNPTGGAAVANPAVTTPPANPAGGSSTATNGTVTPPANPAGGNPTGGAAAANPAVTTPPANPAGGTSTATNGTVTPPANPAGVSSSGGAANPTVTPPAGTPGNGTSKYEDDEDDNSYASYSSSYEDHQGYNGNYNPQISGYEELQQGDDISTHRSSKYEGDQGDDSSSFTAYSSSYEGEEADDSSDLLQRLSRYEEDDSSSYTPQSSSYEEGQQGDDSSSYTPQSSSYEEAQQGDDSSSFTPRSSSYEEAQQGDDSSSYTPQSSSYEEVQQGDDSSSYTPQSSRYEEGQQGEDSSSYTPQSSSYEEGQQGEDSSSYTPQSSSYEEEGQQGDDSSSDTPQSSSYEEGQQGDDSSSYTPQSSSFAEGQQGDDSSSYTPQSSSYEEGQQGDDSSSYTPHSSSYEDGRGGEDASSSPKQYYQVDDSQDSYLPVRKGYDSGDDYEDDYRRRRLMQADGQNRKLKL